MKKSFVKWGGDFSIVSLLMVFLFASCSGGTNYVGGGTGGSGGSSEDGETYTVTIPATFENGKITADKTTANLGDKVTLTVTPDSGYALGTLSVRDNDKKDVVVTTVTEGTEYTFTMPKSNITVSATFKKSDTMPDIYSTGLVGDIVLSDWKYITAENYTKYKSIVSERGEEPVGVVYASGMMLVVPTSEKMTWSAAKSSYGSSPTVNGISGWYIPSKTDIKSVYGVRGTVAISLAVAGLASLDLDGNYWTSTKPSTGLNATYRYYLPGDAIFSPDNVSQICYVLLFRACN